jgi:exopolyphosphatase/guanosine-5'-triphosphate,3'-diphosphate pyrophosphatase
VREAVLAFARACDYEVEHTPQVCRLALQLFDELASLHGLSEEDRDLLEWGALLHDIGWMEGRNAHHKTARRLILGAEDLPLDEGERAIVALVARYHRKAEPQDHHAGYEELSEPDRWRVRVLAGLLRVADGLDRSHRGVVEDLACKVDKHRVRVSCRVSAKADLEARGASRKAGLIESLFQRPWVFDMEEAS